MIQNHQRHSLGHRAFFVFFSRRIKLPIFLFALTIGAWYARRWVPPVYAPWGDYAAQLLLMLSVAYTIAIFLLTYLSYRAHAYLFTEEAFILMSGLATRKEIAALYHQIQNVNIDRSMLARFIGVSDIVIFMTGTDRESGHTKIVLPAVGKMKAKEVQKEILVRARRHVPAAQAGGEV